MAVVKRTILAMVKKIIALEDGRLKAGKYAGEEKKVAEILEMATKIVTGEDE